MLCFQQLCVFQLLLKLVRGMYITIKIICLNNNLIYNYFCLRFIEVETIHNPKLIVVVGVLGLFVNILGLFLFHGNTFIFSQLVFQFIFLSFINNKALIFCSSWWRRAWSFTWWYISQPHTTNSISKRWSKCQCY